MNTCIQLEWGSDTPEHRIARRISDLDEVLCVEVNGSFDDGIVDFIVTFNTPMTQDETDKIYDLVMTDIPDGVRANMDIFYEDRFTYAYPFLWGELCSCSVRDDSYPEFVRPEYHDPDCTVSPLNDIHNGVRNLPTGWIPKCRCRRGDNENPELCPAYWVWTRNEHEVGIETIRSIAKHGTDQSLIDGFLIPVGFDLAPGRIQYRGNGVFGAVDTKTDMD